MIKLCNVWFFFFSSRRRHTRSKRDWSSDVCSSDLVVEVDHRVRVPVSGEKLPDAEGPLAVTRPEDHDVADSTVDQLDPTQDERAHEDLVQLAVGLDERKQVVATDLDDLAGGRGPDLSEPMAARQHGDFAGEHPGFERHD